jgi:tetratricopeptide (TPR) repeat protein
MKRAWALIPLLFLVCPAQADVIHLTTGRAITGTVERETDSEVVVRTPDGRLTFPRDLVERIERQSRGRTLIGLARERARAGDFEEAERLYRRAAEDPEQAVADEATEELEAFLQRRAASERFRARPSTPMELPEGADDGGARPVEGESLQDQLDRARQLLEGNRPDPAHARRLLEPLVRANPEDRRLRYLLGRANELAGLGSDARRLYSELIEDRAEIGDRPTVWLGELARRSVAGDPLPAHGPGVGAGWYRIETEHFTIFHAFRRAPDWIATEAEAALDDAMERLGVLVREVTFNGRIQVFLFPSAAVYRNYQGITNAGGHATRRAAPDGWMYEIHAYPDRSFYRTTFRHEVAHALLFQVAPDVPVWAHEGAAIYAEPESERARYRLVALGRQAEGSLIPLLEFLADEGERGETRESWRGYYAQSSVTFEALVHLREDPRRALQACSLIAQRGPEDALGRLRLSPQVLQREIDQVLELSR